MSCNRRYGPLGGLANVPVLAANRVRVQAVRARSRASSFNDDTSTKQLEGLPLRMVRLGTALNWRYID